MSKKRNSKKTSENNTAVMDATKVRIANGAGRKPIILDFKQGETYAQLFARAGIEPGSDQTVTTGKKVKNTETTMNTVQQIERLVRELGNF